MYICIYDIQYTVYGVFECMCACSPLSGAECSGGLIVWHALGFDAFRVVIIHHLVRDFCQDTLSQSSWGGLQKQIQQRRRRERSQIHTHHWPCVILRCQNLMLSPMVSKGLERRMRSDKLIWQTPNIPAFTFSPSTSTAWLPDIVCAQQNVTENNCIASCLVSKDNAHSLQHVLIVLKLKSELN